MFVIEVVSLACGATVTLEPSSVVAFAGDLGLETVAFLGVTGADGLPGNVVILARGYMGFVGLGMAFTALESLRAEFSSVAKSNVRRRVGGATAESVIGRLVDEFRVEVNAGGGEVGGERRGSETTVGCLTGGEDGVGASGHSTPRFSRALMRMDVGVTDTLEGERGVSRPTAFCAGVVSAGGESTTVDVDDSEVEREFNVEPGDTRGG